MAVAICGVNKREKDMDIKDRVIVVTGAASGIGRSLVKIFYKHGAKHVVSTDCLLYTSPSPRDNR